MIRGLRQIRHQSTLATNQLSKASSPYLIAHSSNPVAWQVWDEATLKLASQQNKPIFLSIGYHTCHWCHVMNRESFSHEDVADVLNSRFVPIKVDKEERPDVDAVYMMYLQATLGRGGWPLNVFLSPKTLAPFFGGTYWSGPGVTTNGTTPFLDVLKSVSEVWQTDRHKCEASAESISQQLSALVKSKSSGGPDELSSEIFKQVENHFSNAFDIKHGGFSAAPKFPCAHNLSFLLRFRASLGHESKVPSMATESLLQIGRGGINDHIGSGFARYSVTRDWNLPHFEKMLYDQALLMNGFIDAWKFADTEKLELEQRVHSIADYLMDGDLSQGSVFYSAQDADSLNAEGKHVEGAYYVWTLAEFERVLRDAGIGTFDVDMAAMFWNVQEYGNVDAEHDPHHELKLQNVLSTNHISAQEVGVTFGKDQNYVEDVLAKCRPILLKHRSNRAKPSVDTKIVAAWNGLAIGALARAGSFLQKPEYLERAKKAANYIFNQMYKDGQLVRIGGSTLPAMSEDYAFLISGLLDLYESSFDIKYLLWARDLQDRQLTTLWDHDHGGFFSSEDQQLVFRPKSAFDSAEPSPNGVSSMNLFRLGSMLQHSAYTKKAEHVVKCYSADIKAQPSGYLSMLGSVLAQIHGMETYAVIGDCDWDKINKLRWQHPLATVIRVDPDFLKLCPNEEYKEQYAHFSNAILYCRRGECAEVI